MARRVPRRPPEVAATEHMRESFVGATRGRSSVPLPVSRDSKLLARMRNGSANPLNVVRAYQDEFVLAGGEETVELTYLPLTYSEHVYLNGVYQREGADYDWTRQSGTRTVTVKAAMDARAGDVLIVEYLYYAGAPVTPVAAGSGEFVGRSAIISGTSVTPTLPTGTSTGDMLLLAIVNGENSQSDPLPGGLSGWTLVSQITSDTANVARTVVVLLYSRVYDSGTYSAPTITSTYGLMAHMYAFSGVTTVSATATWDSGDSISGGTFNATGLTGIGRGAVVLLVGGMGDDGNFSSTLTNANLPNLTTNASANRYTGGQRAIITSHDEAQSTGNTGTVAITGDDGAIATIIVALV